MFLLIATTLLAAALPTGSVDLSQFGPNSGIQIEHRRNLLRAEWTGPDQKSRAAIFSLDERTPLFHALEENGTVVAENVHPIFTVTVGSRIERANERYIFFDKPSTRPTETHESTLGDRTVHVESAGKRASIHFRNFSAGPFSGELIVRLYSGSPFMQVEAAMSVDRKLVAYIYDFTLEGDWQRAAWKDNVTDRWLDAPTATDAMRPVGVRYRTIFGQTQAGTIAVYPPPHAFFFPRDHTVNFKFAQIGKQRFGLRQDPEGGPGHQGAFIPWFDAPSGKIQRMSAFLQVSTEAPKAALEQVKRYTNGDVFKPMDGRFTFTSHWHVRLAMNELAGRPVGAEVARVFKAMNVNLVHLAEFHGDGNPSDPGPKRLPQLKAMFDVCRKYSDDDLLFIPGEEANAHLNIPAPKGTHAGHWMYLFPRPVYLTLVRGEGVPFVEEIPPYGTVYHAGNEADMVEILKREGALAWTAHPRIKASFACPDSYKDKEWYQSDLWLGAAWKSMPADLSEPRLGVRVLDLLDDMNTWGEKKQVIGEVDTFELDSTHELYGHMNINYLKLDTKPTIDDWSPVLGALRRGDFFTTTGEVLVHSFAVNNGKITADIEWTFPLSQILVVTWDGQHVKRRRIELPETTEFQRRTFQWPIDPSTVWVRLEAWDIAINGAFTQPIWLTQ